jgi:8-amino-7-oxononanoate synthase
MAEALGVPEPAGAVLSVPMPGPEEALRTQAELESDGYLVGCFRPPSTPDGSSRIRMSARATLTDDQVEAVLRRLAQTAAAR